MKDVDASSLERLRSGWMGLWESWFKWKIFLPIFLQKRKLNIILPEFWYALSPPMLGFYPQSLSDTVLQWEEWTCSSCGHAHLSISCIEQDKKRSKGFPLVDNKIESFPVSHDKSENSHNVNVRRDCMFHRLSF